MNVYECNYWKSPEEGEYVQVYAKNTGEMIWYCTPELGDYNIPSNQIWYRRIPGSSSEIFAPAKQDTIKELDLTTTDVRTGNRFVQTDYATNWPIGNHCEWTFRNPVGGCIGATFKTNNASLYWMIFPNTFKRCQNETFANCPNLEYVYFGHDFEYLGGNPFNDTPKLNTIVMNVNTLEQLTITSSAFNGAGPDLRIFVPNYLFRDALYVQDSLFQGKPVLPFIPNMPECMGPQ